MDAGLLDKEPRPKPHFGLSPDQLTDGIWQGVVAIYYETFNEGHDPAHYGYGETAEQALDLAGWDGFRYGSCFSGDSKLKILRDTNRNVGFDFFVNSRNPAHRDPETEEGRKVEELRLVFQTRVDELLISCGVASPLDFNY